MTRKEKRLLRMAVAIHEQYRPQKQSIVSASLPTAAWERCETLPYKVERAAQHGWHLAAEWLRRDLRWELEQLRNELAEILCELQPPETEDHRASATDIHADLVALNEEFEEVSFDKQGRTISVTTEPIELEGVYLGPFKIQLDWSEANYRVIALDAQPATSSDSVTHPHVQDEFVCEGEARRPIHNALAQGRLLDFFVIVANLLRTYNSGSPFVPLDQWHGGAECVDCGTRGPEEDDWWSCEKCEETLCEGCYFICADCSETRCSHCVRSCSECLDHFCEDFVHHCTGCDKRICRNCLNDQERCLDCYDQDTEEHETEEETQAAADSQSAPLAKTHAPLQPDRLGQAVVSA